MNYNDESPQKPWQRGPMPMASPPPAAAKGKAAVYQQPSAVVEAIDKISRDREARRQSAQYRKENEAKALHAANVVEAGLPQGAKVDKSTLDFIRMIKAYRSEHTSETRPHAAPGEHDICVVVRKRPISRKEAGNGDYDAVTCINPRVVVHAPKTKVDGITRYLENAAFQFDHTFGEDDNTEMVYKHTVQPLVHFAFSRRGRGTCFAYGQTGSGKTYTMSTIQQLAARDIYRMVSSPAYRDKGLTIAVSFYEVYGGRAFDVLHGRNPVKIQENEKHQVQAVGLQDVDCGNEEELLDVIQRGNASRRTASTEMNDTSSRSHAICQINVRVPNGNVWGSLTLIDLAGSERANSDAKNHNQTRRVESAEINKSLLALKECIRALAQRAKQGPNSVQHVHVPFRASKLTLALRDSFESDHARVVMIACVAPNAASFDHTGNTLRYADRVKEQPSGLGEYDSEAQALAAASEAANGRGPGGHFAKPATTYTVMQDDMMAPRANGALPPRVSPVTVTEGGGVITDAKAPPRNLFQRVGKVPGAGGSAQASRRTDLIDTMEIEAAMSVEEDGEDGDEGLDYGSAPGIRGGVGTGGGGGVAGRGQAGAAQLRSPAGKMGGPQRVKVGKQGPDSLESDDPRSGSGAAAARGAGTAGRPAWDSGQDSSPPAPAASAGIRKPAAGRPVASGRPPVGSLPESSPPDSSPPAASGLARPASGLGRLIQPKGMVQPPASKAPVPKQQQEDGDSVYSGMSGRGSAAPSTAAVDGDRDNRDSARGGPGSGAAQGLPRTDSNRSIKDKFKEKARKAAPNSSAASRAPSASATAGGSVGSLGEEDQDEDQEQAEEMRRKMESAALGQKGGQRGAAAPASRRAAAGRADDIMSSPQRDVKLLHETLKRERAASSGLGMSGELKGMSAGGGRAQGGSGSISSAAAGGTSSSHGPLSGAYDDRAGRDEEEEQEDALLKLHEAVTIIVDEEQDLLEAHMMAIQEDAILLTEEGKLLSSVQGRDGVDYDIGAYASQLHSLLEKKLSHTSKLLQQVKRFRHHLRMEEELSNKIDPATMRPV